jgi:hypothetical protein
MKSHFALPIITALCATVTALFCHCQTLLPITPPKLESPVFTKMYLTEAKVAGSYGAVHLEWIPPKTDSIGIRSFTIIRKLGGDSLYDVFFSSAMIWDTINAFNDKLTPNGFPSDGYILMQYKIFALDNLGRPSDTSAACSLYLAPQPVVDSVDTATWCFRWHSRHIMGSVASYLKVWNAAGTVSWQSEQNEQFGGENVSIPFDAFLPDSLKQRVAEKLYFAIFLQANGYSHQSLNVDSLNVP